MKKVLFYSSVPDKKLFSVTGFYRTDIRILEELGFKVETTNSYFCFLKFWNYDLSFIYFYTRGLGAAIISKLFLKKVIFTGGIDNLDKDYVKSKNKYLIRKFIFKLCYFFSDHCIIVSSSDMGNVKKVISNHRRLKLVPHVIDYNLYEYKDEFKENIISTVVWMHGRINVIRKGVDKLIYVFDEFSKINPNFKLIVIGALGEGTDFLNEIIQQTQLKDNIYFTGSISEEEKQHLLKTSKYYFQLSEFEGFGIAAIEALAAGNIVFHSGKGGLRDSINKYGVLVENNNYRAIAQHLDEIENNYNNYAEFINNGRQYIKDNFSYSVRLDAIRKLV